MPQLTKEETLEIVLDLPSRDGNKILRQHVITLDQALEIVGDIEEAVLTIAEEFAHGKAGFYWGTLGGDTTGNPFGALGYPTTTAQDLWGSLVQFFDLGLEGLWRNYSIFGRVQTKGSIEKDFPKWKDFRSPRETMIREGIDRALWARGGKRKTRKVESRIV